MKFKKIKKNNFSSSSGFTIIETMIAAAVISVGLIGVLTLCTISMKFGKISLNRVIAANLSQEGIEVIRSIRDDIWLSGDLDPWNNSPFNVTGGCDRGIVVWNTLSNKWNWNTATMSQYDGSYSQVGFYLDTNGRYIQGTGSSQTNFYRIIEIYDNLPNVRRVVVKVKWDEGDIYDNLPNVRRVVVKVKWDEGDKFYEIQTEDWLYNWK
jgi:type II secretory pathway pseudopilin PulG